MSSPPAGTVTFLLADVEGSTALQNEAAGEYPAIIRRIRSLLREAVAAHAGYESGRRRRRVARRLLRAREGRRRRARGPKSLPGCGLAGRAVRAGSHRDPHGHAARSAWRATRASTSCVPRVSRTPATEARSSPPQPRSRGWTESRHATSASHRLEGLPAARAHPSSSLADDLPRDFPPLRNTIATLGNAMTRRARGRLRPAARGSRATARRVGIRGRGAVRTTPRT